MRIEMFGKDMYSIFLNKKYINNILLSSREEIVGCVKTILYKLKTRLKLHGFYKVKVYPQEKVGIFLDVIKLDESDLSNNLDLRIVVYLDEDIYFETEDYFLLEDYKDIRYFDGLFYCKVDDNFDKLLEKVEFGRFIYGKEVNKVLNNSLIL